MGRIMVMKKLKKQVIGVHILSLLFSLGLFAFTFIGGIENSSTLLFAYRFLASTTPLLIAITLISVARLRVAE